MLSPLPASQALQTSSLPTRVLVMDAEPLVRWSLCAALTAAGFDAVAGADAETARQLAAEWPPPRIAVLDLGAERLECLDILTTLRAFYPSCRCIVMSTERHATLPPPFADAVEIIHKPYDLAQVVRMVCALATHEPTRAEIAP